MEQRTAARRTLCYRAMLLPACCRRYYFAASLQKDFPMPAPQRMSRRYRVRSQSDDDFDRRPASKAAMHTPETASVELHRPHSGIRQLQRLLGNQALQRLIQPTPAPPGFIQRESVQQRLQNHIAASNSPEKAKIGILAQHLLNIMGLINTGDFPAAYALLKDRGVAGQIGYKISDTSKVIYRRDRSWGSVLAELEQTAKRGFHKNGNLLLPDAGVVDDGDDIQQMKTAGNDPRLANLFLPVMLEEWMHAFQGMIGGFISESTEMFSMSSEVTENQQLPVGTHGRYDLKEVDIYAVYRELGWNHLLDTFRSRYTERARFEDHMLSMDELERRTNVSRAARRGNMKAVI
jgi:hypothetical protein